jgi:hypothetical protein
MTWSYHVYECEGERGRQKGRVERESEREIERGVDLEERERDKGMTYKSMCTLLGKFTRF